ncbi:MAG TPA: class I SAM-dependent methyltransferase [Pyrinomonadaceae bacterium]|nr:class I SAM-dependent methyltransferase [Pyrinomonadaceae bacterium]
MAEPQPDAYDVVTYPNFAFPQTHPDRLASLARLFGMSPVPVERCRVLELACGNGGNLIPMAFTLPDSKFVGIDRAQQPIANGQATIAALGLKNIELKELDINEGADQLEEFDYIIAHGVYSWIPLEVRNRLLEICRSRLSPNGVVYISYNTYPGCHLRRITRELMLFHTKDTKHPSERVAQARALINWLADSQKPSNAYQLFLSEVRKDFSQKAEAVIYHDDLAEINSPVYFHQFAQHAAQYGLQFLSEAEYFDVQYSQLPPAVSEQLHLLGERDILSKEQYLDYLEGRSFRQTLLCHSRITLERDIPPARVRDFYLRAEVRPLSDNPDIHSNAVEEFQGKKGSAITTAFALGKAALVCLGEKYPRSLPFEVLSAEAHKRIGSPTEPDPENEAKLEELLLKAHGAGLIEMHLHVSSFALEPGERPVASPLARLQARDGSIITNLLHNNIKLEDDLGRQLLLLLDGTRDRSALFKEFQLAIGQISEKSSDRETLTKTEEFLKTLPTELEEKLGILGQLGLLLA